MESAVRENPKPIEPELIAALSSFQNRDGKVKQAEEKLWLHFYPSLRDRVVRYFPRNPDLAEDMVQEFYVAKSGFAYSLHKWRAGGRSPENYVLANFSNFCKNQLRDMERRLGDLYSLDEEKGPDDDRPRFEPAHAPSPTSRPLAALVQEIILDSISEIEPDTYRRFIQLHFFFAAHLSRKEMVALLGVSNGTLGSGIKRAMDALEQAVGRRLEKNGLSLEDLSEVFAFRFDVIRESAFKHIKPVRTRRLVIEVIERRSAMAVAESNGLDRDEIMTVIVSALDQLMHLRMRRGRRRPNWFQQLSEITAGEWEKLVISGASGLSRSSLVYNQLQAIINGKPIQGMRSLLIASALDSGGYRPFAKAVGMTTRKLAAYIAGVDALDAMERKRVQKRLGISKAQMKELEENDLVCAIDAHMRGRRTRGRNLLRFELAKRPRR